MGSCQPAVRCPWQPWSVSSPYPPATHESFRSRFAFDPRMLGGMADVTQILAAIEQGDPHAAEGLLPLVYEELRKLAAAQMAREKAGQTLQATSLVHEASPRLGGDEPHAHRNSRGHFIAAAAEAMHRIPVENARRKKT